MGWSDKAILSARINTITNDVDGIDNQHWDGSLDEFINRTKFKIAEKLVNRGWAYTDLVDWARLEETHTCLALHDFVVNMGILKFDDKPELLEELEKCLTELDDIDVLLKSDGTPLDRSSTGADAGSPILSSSRGKARNQGRDYDLETEPGEEIYFEEPFH